MSGKTKYQNSKNTDNSWQTPLERERFTNKRVALVGNAFSLLDRAYGDIIDNHDVVCKFNGGINEFKPESRGKRLDIAFLNVAQYWNSPDQALVVHVSNHLRERRNIYYIPSESNDQVAALVGIDRPSSGLMVLHYIINSNPCIINLFGFDWKNTPTFYYIRAEEMPHDYEVEPHDYEAERKHVLSVLSQHCVLWP